MNNIKRILLYISIVILIISLFTWVPLIIAIVFNNHFCREEGIASMCDQRDNHGVFLCILSGILLEIFIAFIMPFIVVIFLSVYVIFKFIYNCGHKIVYKQTQSIHTYDSVSLETIPLNTSHVNKNILLV